MHFTLPQGIMSSDYHLLLFMIILSPLLISLMILFRRNSTGKGCRKLPPGPRGWPVIGNLLNIDGKNPHIALANFAESFGPLISLKLGARLIVVASNPAAAKEVYRYHDRELSGIFKPMFCFLLPQLNNSAIVMQPECDDQWRSLRGMSHTEMFSSQALESQSKLRLEKVKQMVDFLTSKEGEVVNIVDIIFATFADMISNIMVSHDIVGDWEKAGEIKAYLKSLVESATPGFSDLYPTLAVLDYFVMKKKVATYLKMAELLWFDVISKRRMLQDKDDQKPDFLDVLIKHSWDDVQIYNLLTEFFASTDSLTTTVEWAMSELLRNQDALFKLQEEIEQATKQGQSLQEHDLDKLPYLQDCIKETFRLHPPTPFLVPRAALHDCKVMGFDVPKDSLVVINAYALGRDVRTWEDPERFKPERFHGKNVDMKGTNYGLLPFGGGKRLCAGHPLALKHIQLVLATLVHAFDWSVEEGKNHTSLDMSEDFGVTLPKKNSLRLILKRRNDLKIE